MQYACCVDNYLIVCEIMEDSETVAVNYDQNICCFIIASTSLIRQKKCKNFIYIP